MEITPVSNRMFSLIVLYEMHTKFLIAALDGIADKDAHNRLNTKANHIAWLTGSLVHQRFEMATYLGIDRKQASFELFKDNKGVQDEVTYPPLSEFKKDWDSISPVLQEAYANVTDEKLNSLFEMPDMKMPFYDMLSFVTYREANIIGQLALWRRLLGYDAMKYM